MDDSALQEIADQLRVDALDMICDVKDGHPGPAFSVAEIVTALYFDPILALQPENPQWEDRDRFVLSKGHACPILYAALMRKGFFPKSEHLTLRKINSILQGHPYIGKTPGIDANSGSLGNGLGAAVGIARALKIQKKSSYVYVICGDGELEEGIVWEAFRNMNRQRLDNLVVFIDYNTWQSGGTVEAVGGVIDLKSALESFKLQVLEIDGHDFKAIKDAVATAKTSPVATVVIAHTIKGKGVDFMEQDNSWHKRVPTPEQYTNAVEQLLGVNKSEVHA